MLEISALGGVVICRDGGDITAQITRKVQALLIYLACNRQAQSREFLAELLWFERSPEQALTNLRTVLTYLRRDFDAYLVISRQFLAIDTDADVRVDALQLDNAINAAWQQWRQHRMLSPAAKAKLEEALTLYRGRFLEGFSIREGLEFENWMSAERERLHQSVIEAIHRLLMDAAAQGLFAESIPQATRLVELDPLREESHQQLISFLAYAGERSAALMQYQTCRRLLWDELGVEPSAETKALYEKLRRDEIRVASTPVRLGGNLPSEPAIFVGRQTELQEIAARLNDTRCRLLTLIGPGGIGKTSLALRAAAEEASNYAHGVYFVSLSGSATDFLAHAIAESIGLSFHSQSDVEPQLLSYFRHRQMLLVLDNFEDLLGGTLLLLDILLDAPQIKMLVTSRERLKLKEEWLFDVPGLSFPGLTPEAIAAAETYEAVQMFYQRALQIQPGFELKENLPAVAAICQLVEGMPLGIELASSWVRLFSCEEIAHQIRRSLDILATTQAVPERHRSLRAAFEHSWDLLSENERNALMKLSVFHGGFALDAAQHIAAAPFPVLATLADKSLVYRQYGSRFNMHVLLRQFAAEKLEQAALTRQTQAAHLAYFVRIAEETRPKLESHEQAASLAYLKADIDNLRAALTFSQDEGAIEQRLRLGSALIHFWRMGSLVDEGLRQLEAILKSAGSRMDSPLFAQATAGAGLLAIYRNDFVRATSFAETARELAQRVGDSKSKALAFNVLGTAARSAQEYDRAETLYDQALSWATVAGDQWLMSLSLGNQGIMAFQRGDCHKAASLMEESLTLNQQAGSNFDVGLLLNLLGRVQRCLGNYSLAFEYCRQSIDLSYQQGDVLNFGVGLSGLAALSGLEGQWQRAASLMAIQSELFERDNLVMMPAFRADHEATLKRIEAALGLPALRTKFRQGQKTSLDEALAFALAGEA